ncbi:MAG: helix-turn-helix domain-containing protein [Candidatus Heimdallarchaeota archaeon]
MFAISQKQLTANIKAEISQKSLTEVFSDPARVNVLFQIYRLGETTQQALQPLIGISRSTLSHHLRILVDSGLLAVRVNPTGRPIKNYSLKEAFLKIGLDRKKLLESSKDEKSRQIFSLLQSIVVHHQLLARNSLGSLEFVKKNMPFSGIKVDDENHIHFQLNDRTVQSPMFAMMKINAEGAKYFGKRVLKLIQECQERFCPEDEQTNLEKSREVEYLIHLGSFPSFHYDSSG